MKLNTSLFAVKERIEVKSESLVDDLDLMYEKNFKLINQILFSSSVHQKRFNYPHKEREHFVLNSNQPVPDIHVEVNFLSQFTVDIEMYNIDNVLENITYFYHLPD